MLQENQLSQQVVLYGGLALSLLANIALVVKFFLERKTSSEVNAYNQLSQLFDKLQKEVDKKELKDREQEADYETLELKFDVLNQKVKKATLDLMEVKHGFNELRRFIKEHNLANKSILQTIEEIEAKIKEISDQLK